MNNFDAFTELQQTFKSHLLGDKKYQPILKSLAGLLKTIKPQTTEVYSELKQIDKIYATHILNLTKKYNTFLENVDRSQAIAIKKHQKWMETTQKQKNQDSTILQNELRLKLEAIDDDIEKGKLDFKVELAKLETIHKRELASIQKDMQELKKTLDLQNEVIESEKADTLQKLKRIYDQKIKALDEQVIALESENETVLENFKIDHDEKVKLSDDQYLQIKNDYSQLSIHLNQKINEIKKVYQKDIEQLKSLFEREAKPMMKAIEALKTDYKESNQKTLDAYQEKLSSLNTLFDQQKDAFEQKKQRIINEINAAITLLNSKLSAFRESVQKDKLQTSRAMRAEMKMMSSDEADKHNRMLTRHLNQFDNDLNKQIVRTQKDIDSRHALMQKNLYAHDQNHLKEINTWRLTKTIYSYEHKQELAKLELNYNYNLSDLNLQLKRLSLVNEFDKEKRLLTHNRNLLPLEFQLTIGSLVQERELNLLSNDKHSAHDEYTYVAKVRQLEYKLNQTQLLYDQKIAKANFQSDEAVLLTMSQLELQKEKLKYETGVLEQTLRKDIQDSILAKNMEALEHELKLSERHMTLSKHKIETETKTQVAKLNHEVIVLYHHQTNRVENLKVRTLHLKSIRKTQRHQKLLAYELERQQKQLELMINHQLFLSKHFFSYINSIEDLYLIPAHPELFKSFLKNITGICEAYHGLCINTLHHFKALDLGYHQNKIEDTSSHKGQLRFDHEVTILNHQIERIEKIKDELYKEVKQLGSQILTLQTMIEKETQTIKQLLEEQQIQTGNAKIQEITQHIKDREKNSAKLMQNRDQLDQRITALHKKMVPLDDKITRIENKRNHLSHKYKQEKSSYQMFFKRALDKNTQSYDRLENKITSFKMQMQSFVDDLSGESYVTDSLLKQTKHTIFKSLEHFNHHMLSIYHQLLSQASNVYKKQHKQQVKIADRFKKALDKALRQQGSTHLEQRKLQHRKFNMQLSYLIRTHKGIFDQITKEIATYKKSYQMRLGEYVLKIRANERKLESEALKFQNEMKLLNDNQIDVAKAYQNDHQITTSLITKQLEKESAEIISDKDALSQSHEEYIQSTHVKNKALITKYETNHQKQVELLKAKKDHYQNRIKKETQVKDKKVADLNHEKMLQTKRRIGELKNMHAHLLTYQNNAKKEQNLMLRKDLKILRKSYRFKIKALHLNP